jgi:hypothetical protein
MNEKRPPEGARTKAAQRKPYSRPKLQRYGAIRAITKDIGSMGMADGGTVPKTKSQI